MPPKRSSRCCRLCRDDFYAFDFARSYGVYNDALHHAILLLKYEEVTRLGDWFAARLAELVAREAEAFRADVIVPVPFIQTASANEGIIKRS